MATRNIESLDAPLYIGNGANRVAIATDGSFRLEGNATAYKDMIGNLFGQRLNSSSGKIDYDWDENALLMQSGGSISTAADRVQWNNEINHEFEIGTSISFEPHVHWWQSDTTQRELTLQWRFQANGEAKDTTWTDIVLTLADGNEVFTYTSGTLCQITDFPSIVVTCGMSDTLQFRMARTDALSGDLYVYFVDLHGKIDSLGSETEYTKD